MPSKLTYNKNLEIRELLFFKSNSLMKNELFLETMMEHKHVELLEIDIDLTIQEISELEDILTHQFC